VDGYLIDTNAICELLDERHPNHQNVRDACATVEAGAPRFISCITLAEIRFGALLNEAATGQQSPRTAAILNESQKYLIREITRHTAREYAELKTKIATTYLLPYIRANRPHRLENWLDRATGERLQIDENDLWICAQAKEWNLTVMTTDKKMVDRVSKADLDWKHLFIPTI
jgi:predicted nucleic acid-binding protein